MRERTKKRAAFIFNPFEFTKKMLGDKRSGQLVCKVDRVNSFLSDPKKERLKFNCKHRSTDRGIRHNGAELVWNPGCCKSCEISLVSWIQRCKCINKRKHCETARLMFPINRTNSQMVNKRTCEEPRSTSSWKEMALKKSSYFIKKTPAPRH